MFKILVLLLLLSLEIFSQNISFENFESNDSSWITDDPYNGRSFTVGNFHYMRYTTQSTFCRTKEKAFSGKYSLKVNWAGDVASSPQIHYIGPSLSSGYMAGMFYLSGAKLSASQGEALKLFVMRGDGSPDTDLMVWHDRNTGKLRFAMTGANPSTWMHFLDESNNLFNANYNEWIYVKVYFDLENGVFDVWINNRHVPKWKSSNTSTDYQTFPIYNFGWNTSTLNHIRYHINFSGGKSPKNGKLYVDDIYIGEKDPGNQLVDPPTIPGKPTGIKIIN